MTDKTQADSFVPNYGQNLPPAGNNTGTPVAVKQDAHEPVTVIEAMDGAALQIARGTGRYFRALNCGVMAELPLADGRRCDLMALDPRGDIAIVEIKSCLADFRCDQKWPEYRQWCDRFYFAVDSAFPLALIPEDCGLILADRFGAEMLREAPEHRLSAARRKAVTLRFARCCAFRLHEAFDPEARTVGLL